MRKSALPRSTAPISVWLAVRENLMKQFGVSVDETVLERVIRHGTADISQRYLTAIRDTATEYAGGNLPQTP